MKKHAFTLVLLACSTFLYCCKPKKEKAFQTGEGITGVVSKLNDAFGKDAYYTDITISFVKNVGTTVSATGTKDPGSAKLTSKLNAGGDWQDVSDVTLEVSGGAKPADFMFTLAQVDGLKKVPDMVKVAIETVKKEKNFDVVAEHVSVKYPSRKLSPNDSWNYSVNLAPENGGTSFIALFDDKGQYQRIIY